MYQVELLAVVVEVLVRHTRQRIAYTPFNLITCFNVHAKIQLPMSVQAKTLAGLYTREWAFLIISFINIATAVALTFVRLVQVVKDDPASPDFTFVILLLINAGTPVTMATVSYIFILYTRHCIYHCCMLKWWWQFWHLSFCACTSCASTHAFHACIHECLLSIPKCWYHGLLLTSC